jgi:hypothetical protein
MSNDEANGRAVRAARNQALYRLVNERVTEVNDGLNPLLPLSEWICECANEECSDEVLLTRGEYERVRAFPTRFFVKPHEHHVFGNVERVAEQHERYWVVEKVGVAAALVRRDDAQRGQMVL